MLEKRKILFGLTVFRDAVIILPVGKAHTVAGNFFSAERALFRKNRGAPAARGSAEKKFAHFPTIPRPRVVIITGRVCRAKNWKGT